MTKLPQRIDFSPDTLYPDRGCVSWPSCLDCPFDPCINTADKDPTKPEQQRAQVRKQIILLYGHDMPNREIGVALGVSVQAVDRGLATYRADTERARLKAIEEHRKTLVRQGVPTLEATT